MSKFIQFVAFGAGLAGQAVYALDDEGTIWYLIDGTWKALPPFPSKKQTEAER